jgi:hypothetical protein
MKTAGTPAFFSAARNVKLWSNGTEGSSAPWPSKNGGSLPET